MNSVDDAKKSISVIYGGAYSGTYNINIKHKTLGKLDTEGLILVVGSEVKSFSPSQGSVYGGTILTILGNNWDAKVKENNPV